MSTHTLKEDATLVSIYGNTNSAKRILQHLATHKGWCDETFRARWDGTSALLAWWHTLERHERPPLWDLSEADAREFLEHLESMDLARTTIKGYRTGAAAFSGWLRAYRSQPVAFDPSYQPFKNVLPPRDKQQVLATELDLSALTSAKYRAKLGLLLALLDLGMSLPEACTRAWQDLDFLSRRLVGYRQRTVILGVEVLSALEELETFRPKRHGSQKLIGWTPATARKWLNRVSI